MTEQTVCDDCNTTIMPLRFGCYKCKCYGCIYRDQCKSLADCKVCQNQCNGQIHCEDCDYMVRHIVNTIELLSGEDLC